MYLVIELGYGNHVGIPTALLGRPIVEALACARKLKEEYKDGNYVYELVDEPLHIKMEFVRCSLTPPNPLETIQEAEMPPQTHISPPGPAPTPDDDIPF